MTNPDLTIFVEIRENDTFIYHEKIKGPGGLPLGTQGKVVVLLSSGIDSPVAAYMMMKRGCEVIALNCNNAPFTTPKALENFNLLVDQLNIYAKGVPIKKHVVDYGEYLQMSMINVPLKDLKLPDYIIIAVIHRGMETIISDGNTRIKPGDRVIIVCMIFNIGYVEKLFKPNIRLNIFK